MSVSAVSEPRSASRSPRWQPWAGRVPFALRSLLHDRVRLALSLGGMMFAVALVLLLRGIMDGTVAQSTSYIDHVGADVFIAQAGVTNMALASSVLPADAESVAAGEGVAAAAGIVRVNVIARHGNETAPAQFVGYPASPGLGGPWKLAEGRRPAQPGEAVVDSQLANELGTGVGGTLAVAGREFAVVGTSTGTASIATKFVFVSLADAQETLGARGMVGFLLLDLAPGIDAKAFAAGVRAQHPTLSVLTRDELSANDRDLLSRLFVGPINVMSTVGFLVGLAVVGLTMYTTTNERMRDFGVLKAIGAPPRYLLGVVATQSLVIGALGFGLGLTGTWLVGPIVQHAVPDIRVTVHLAQVVRVGGAVAAMAVGAAFVPVARILRVDPLLVFRR